jgi:hypothetical protein
VAKGFRKQEKTLSHFHRITTLGNQVFWVADDGDGPVFARWDGPGQPLMLSLGSAFYSATSSAEMRVLATEADAEAILRWFEKEAEHESNQAQ